MIKTILNLAVGVSKKIKLLFVNPYNKVGISFFRLRIIKNLPDKKFNTINFLEGKLTFFSKGECLHSIDEIFLEEIYKQELPQNALIIDCGANIGLSVIYLKRKFPDARIIAFEPDRDNYALIKKNLTHFGFEITLRQEAIWISETQIEFMQQGSLMSRISDKKGDNTYSVPAIRLRDIIAEPVHFLKIDIEGAEYRVIKDIEDKLYLVDKMFLEYHGTYSQNNELNDIFNLITRNGFTYYVKHASDKHPTPFSSKKSLDYDIQLNIFCFRTSS